VSCVDCDYDTCVPWELNTGCCPDWDSLHFDLRNQAVELAWSAMKFLSGGLLGNCPVSLRPCAPARGCGSCSSVFTDTAWMPHIYGGEWYNSPRCFDSGCSCEFVADVVLPGKVAAIDKVLVDGFVLPCESYRLDNGNRLVRTDGFSWPSCQNMHVSDWDLGSFAVHYVPGVKPNAAGLWAAGVLACEFAKACNGGKCRLPSSVTSVVRQGVSMEFDNSMFANGQTGIREVDAYLLSINPNKLKVPPRVWSPDQREGRFVPVTELPQ